MAKHIRRDVRNAEAVKTFGRFLMSEDGRRWSTSSSIPNAPVVVAIADDTLKDLLDRIEENHYEPPVRVAIVEGSTVHMVLFSTREAETGEQTIDPASTLGMIIDLVVQNGGSLTFQASKWSFPAEVRQLADA